MRWKAFFFLNPKADGTNRENYGFKSTKTPPVIEELKEFEERVTSLIQNIEFENKRNDFQDKMKHDLKAVKRG